MIITKFNVRSRFLALFWFGFLLFLTLFLSHSYAPTILLYRAKMIVEPFKQACRDMVPHNIGGELIAENTQLLPVVIAAHESQPCERNEGPKSTGTLQGGNAVPVAAGNSSGARNTIWREIECYTYAHGPNTSLRSWFVPAYPCHVLAFLHFDRRGLLMSHSNIPALTSSLFPSSLSKQATCHKDTNFPPSHPPSRGNWPSQGSSCHGANYPHQ